MERTIELVNEQMLGKEQKILFVTHGNLLALLIKYYQPNFGFEEWGKLSNPDVYLLEMNQMTVAINRIWK
ncbi:hypothetical protein [Ornithinibacillus scapharcae]|uniref:hypothetical protein n=1 Tax=Ornithinibacillus scapharcae TaxID=1147159 RepID=UPI000225C010